MKKIIGFKEDGEMKLYVTEYQNKMIKFLTYLAANSNENTYLEFVIDEHELQFIGLPVLTDEDIDTQITEVA